MRFLFIIFLIFTSLSSWGQELRELVLKNNYKKIEKFLFEGGDINQPVVMDWGDDEFGIQTMSGLVLAVGVGSYEVVDFYLDYEDSVSNFKSELGKAFALSFSQDFPELTAHLYEYGPDLTSTCDVCNDANALMLAASYGNEEWYFKLKTEMDPYFISSKNMNLLHYAASSPSQKILDDALSIEGLNINLRSYEDAYPISFAASNVENSSAFNALVNAGAEVSLAQNDLYQYALDGSSYDAIKYIFDHQLTFNLWEFNANIQDYPLGFSLQSFSDGTYTDNQDKLCLILMNGYIENIKSSNCNTFELDLIESGYFINDLANMCMYFQNQELFAAYCRLLVTFENCVDEEEHYRLALYKKDIKLISKAIGAETVAEITTETGVSIY